SPSYVVPEGWCTAVTVAPGITAPCTSETSPVILPVVTPCANAGRAETTSANSAPIAYSRRDLFKCFITLSCLWNRGKDLQFYLAGYDGNAKKGCLAIAGQPWDPMPRRRENALVADAGGGLLAQLVRLVAELVGLFHERHRLLVILLQIGLEAQQE